MWKMLKQFLNYFRIWIGLLAAVGVAYLIYFHSLQGRVVEYYDSPNTERVYGDQRIFDYGNKLTDQEEADLETLIHQAEKKTCLDLVIVTLDQSLKDYAPEYRANYDQEITPDEYVMVYADKFWEDNKFGYDCPQVLDGSTDTGDGILLVDNNHREEETGKIYTWLCTTGRAEEAYNSLMIEDTLDAFYSQVEYDYYQACVEYIHHVEKEMGEKSSIFLPPSIGNIFLCAVICCIYFFTASKGKSGDVTVDAKSYLKEDSLDFSVRRDVLINKTVSKRYSAPSSSGGGGGGGGHHRSGGGGSHGGGGRSR
ncbi:MAG: TPM domain-containing protein [Eubacterium sp.]|nr:TPM domain-containing protein [Eubacterium sp.]